MIISRTPLRISFAGGGSDLRAFYLHEPGAVVSTAVNKFIYITINKKFDDRIRASYSETENVDHVDQVRHDLIRETLRMVGFERGLEITSVSDIPSRGTGLGSSSSCTVGLLNALYAYKGRYAGAERLAHEACEIEIERLGAPIGKQDQYIAAYGGLHYLQFNPDDSVVVEPITCSRERKRTLQEHLLLLYTGMTRSTAAILAEQRAGTEQRTDHRQALREMTRLARELRDALSGTDDDPRVVGEILHEGWMRKRELASGISDSRIDAWYECARQHGAIGGKILGAGGGGFLLLYAPPERHVEIVAGLPQLRLTPFRFEPQGSRIVFVEEGGD